MFLFLLLFLSSLSPCVHKIAAANLNNHPAKDLAAAEEVYCPTSISPTVAAFVGIAIDSTGRLIATAYPVTGKPLLLALNLTTKVFTLMTWSSSRPCNLACPPRRDVLTHGSIFSCQGYDGGSGNRGRQAPWSGSNGYPFHHVPGRSSSGHRVYYDNNHTPIFQLVQISKGINRGNFYAVKWNRLVLYSYAASQSFRSIYFNPSFWYRRWPSSTQAIVGMAISDDGHRIVLSLTTPHCKNVLVYVDAVTGNAHVIHVGKSNNFTLGIFGPGNLFLLPLRSFSERNN